MIRNYLPIGSVILLEGAEKPLMIYGVKQLDSDNPDEEFDYIGVLYPEGNIGEEFHYLFNHEDIAEVIFKGYENDEFHDFIDALAEAYGE